MKGIDGRVAENWQIYVFRSWILASHFGHHLFWY